ncbi:MAG TPA: hypothetical protein VGQ11_03355, partial [Candidatus Acidoferrales bacterium]|nr:hypothetical protein [Candidatus Acidoferrales bacterium]
FWFAGLKAAATTLCSPQKTPCDYSNFLRIEKAAPLAACGIVHSPRRVRQIDLLTQVSRRSTI